MSGPQTTDALGANLMTNIPERRRLPREGVDPRVSLEHALSSWRLLKAAWIARLEEARAADDKGAVAAAEAKLDECERELARIGKLLEGAGSSK
jgi:hypothetical protein